jgi:hypothetical protein
MTGGGEVRIAKIGMIVITPMVQLHQHLAVADKLLIFPAAMTALAAEQPLIPGATGLDVPYGY